MYKQVHDAAPARPRPLLHDQPDRASNHGAPRGLESSEELGGGSQRGGRVGRVRTSRVTRDAMRVAVGASAAALCLAACWMAATPREELVQTTVGTYGEEGGKSVRVPVRLPSDHIMSPGTASPGFTRSISSS